MSNFQAPSPPAQPSPPSVPVLAMCAPVVGAVVLWLVTQMPMMLFMAFLGPLIGIAGLGDAKRSTKKQRKRERERFDRECRALEERVSAAKTERARVLKRAVPPVRVLTQREANDAERWRWTRGMPLAVCVGEGTVESGITVESPAVPADAEIADALRRLSTDAAFMTGPVVLDAARGIGVVGPAPLARAMARSLVMQVAELLEPRSAQVIAVGSGWEWLERSPHDVVLEEGATSLVRIVADEVDATIAIASDSTLLPRDCRQVVRVRLDSTDADGSMCVPDILSEREVQRVLDTWTDAAAHAGIIGGTAVPSLVRLADLPPAEGGVLAATFLHAGHPCQIDLAADGPHAVVGGTSGAGKSELLIAWIAALAARYTPDEVAVLLVDFKGGASFGPLTDLAHCVGLITDLDEHQAIRAIESLRAEMRYRERVLAEHGAKSIDETDALGRLVIVVDEFAAMLHEIPDLHKLFADIAARGRSLGMHLILCTQRPAEAVRGTVLANCGIRISLRVTDETDAVAVTGTKDAAHFGLDQRGRCIVRIAGGVTTTAQSALASAEELARLVAETATYQRPRRPWRDPLPPVVPMRELELDGDSYVLGMVDRPALQRVDTLRWRPSIDGPLLALGASASGKTSLVCALASQGAEVITDEASLWDALAEPLTPGLTVIDDLDLLLARAGEQYASILATNLATRIREGAASHRGFAMTARRVTTNMGQLAPLADVRIILRLASRQEHVIAGGQSDRFDSGLQPGAAWVDGERVQLALSSDQPIAREPVSVPMPSGRVAFVVPDAATADHWGDGTSPADVASNAHGDRVAGTVSEWEAAWGSLERLAQERPIVFLDVDERAVRSVLRGAPTPPLTRGRKAWLLHLGQCSRIAHPQS